MKQRTITALWMALLFIPIVIFGDYYHIFEILALLLGVGAAIEFRLMWRKTRAIPLWIDVITILFSALNLVSFFYLITSDFTSFSFVILLVLEVLFYAVLYVFVESFDHSDFGSSLITVFYTSLGFASLAILRDISLWMLLYLLLVAMATDTFAYLFGIRFGKHRLAPKISPKKSVEGSVYGLIFGSVFATVFAYFTNLFDIHIAFVFLLSALLSAIAQIGDLVASRFKRAAGVKDYSNLFPGHGGILDRFDSSMFAAIYLVIALLVVTGI